MTLMLLDFEDLDQDEITEILAEAERIRREGDERELWDLYRQTTTTERNWIWQSR